ncbi:multiheme c-type cytochrome [candidate division KSB1 bacterium]
MKKIHFSSTAFILFIFIFFTDSTQSQEETKYQYKGAEKCGATCHKKKEMGNQYNTWKESPHSKAFTILSSEKAKLYADNAGIEENPAESAVCLKCHVTGGGLDESYFTATFKKEDGITCEACHKREYAQKTFLPKEEDCLKCHDNSVHPVPEFDFEDRCGKIAHPRPKEKSRKK